MLQKPKLPLTTQVISLLAYSILKILIILQITIKIWETIPNIILAIIASIIIVLGINYGLRQIEKNIFKKAKEQLDQYQKEQKQYENQTNNS